jgi:hypothetical protein
VLSKNGEYTLTMKLSLFILGFLAAVVCIDKPAEAQNSAWCAYYDMGGGATNCGFATFQQCSAAVSGIGGSCGRNPQYQAAPGPYFPLTRHLRRYS